MHMATIGVEEGLHEDYSFYYWTTIREKEGGVWALLRNYCSIKEPSQRNYPKSLVFCWIFHENCQFFENFLKLRIGSFFNSKFFLNLELGVVWFWNFLENWNQKFFHFKNYKNLKPEVINKIWKPNNSGMNPCGGIENNFAPMKMKMMWKML